MFLKQWFCLETILTYHVLPSETEVFYREWKHGLKRARGVMHKRRASIPSKEWKVSFKIGHFALRREENIVEFLEGRFRKQQLWILIFFFQSTKRKLSIQLNFPFPFVSFNDKVLKCETLVLKTTVWCDSQIARYSHKMLLFVFKQEKFEKRSA